MQEGSGSVLRGALPAALWYLGYLVLLVTVPTWVPLPDDVASAAASEGYNPATAYQVAVGWSLAGVALFALLARRTGPGATPTPLRETRWWTRTAVVEAAAVFAISIVLYFPTFLAKHGPFVEDGNMLTILHRMHGGQIPFIDFTFLYGPLMIYPLHAWTKLWGYSMASYYTYLALLVGLQYAILAVIVNRFLADRTSRIVAFLLIGSFLVETLLGVNWNGTRRFVSPLMLLAVSLAPARRSAIILAGVVLGAMLAYSHDYGVGGLAAVIGMYGLRALHRDFWPNVRTGVVIGTLAVLVWLVVAVALLREGFPSYVETMRFLVGRYSQGEAAFRFSWTLNSLAVFGLICVACWVVGRGLRSLRSSELRSGDRFLFGALVYSMVILRSGLNRCDFWHLTPAIIALAMAFVLPWSRAMFHMTGARRLGVALTAVCAFTYLVGSMPSGSYYASGWARGVVDTLRPGAERTTAEIDTVAPSLLWESGLEPDPDLVALAGYFAEEPRRGTPVLFYGETWSMGKMVGVYKTDRLMDDLLFSDSMGHGLRDFLEERSDVLILVEGPSWNRLSGIWAADDFREYAWYAESVTKRIGIHLASVHFKAIEVERRALESRLQRTVAPYIRENFEERTRFGDYVVLGRKGSGV